VDAWFWDLGDMMGPSVEQNPVYTYTAAGDYEVTLWVTNTEGMSWTMDVVTVNPLPTGSFVYAPASGLMPLTVNFTATLTDALPPTWDFGDGETGTGVTIQHTYATTGTFSVTMAAVSLYGCGSVYATGSVYVWFAGPPVAEFTADLWSGFAPLDVQFTDESVGTPSIFAWTWDFGDGGTSTETNPLHTFAMTGTLDVVLTVENVSGTASVTHTVEVWPLPEARFEQDVEVGYTPLPVYFTSTALYAISPTWNFGDGSPVAYGDFVSHTYVATGTFNVVLTVTSPYSGGVIATAMGTVTTYEPGQCIPVSIVSVNQTPAGCVVDFAVTLLGTAPFTYQWDFGAFGTFTTSTGTVNFGATGTYTGTLDVYNCTNSHDMAAIEVTVTCVAYNIYLPVVFK
jgi:PKD repeat protein